MHALLLGSLLFTNAGEAQLQAVADATAEGMRGLDLDFRAQGQITATASFADGDVFDLAEAELAASVWGLGAAIAVGYDRLQPERRGTLHGGHVRLAWQFRPLTWLDMRPHAFRWIDPTFEFGGALGGYDDENGSASFLGFGYLGAGIDLSPFPDDFPIVLTVRYRWTPDSVRAPSDLPEHHLVLGLGYRGAE